MKYGYLDQIRIWIFQTEASVFWMGFNAQSLTWKQTYFPIQIFTNEINY